MLTKPENLEMVAEFKRDMPAGLSLEFERRTGTDQMLCFFLHWRLAGYKRGSMAASYVKAEYSEKRKYKSATTLARHPGIMLLVNTFERNDAAFMIAIDNHFFRGLEEDMRDPEKRVRIYSIWERCREKRLEELEEALQKSERVAKNLLASQNTPQDFRHLPTPQLMSIRDSIDAVLEQRETDLN